MTDWRPWHLLAPHVEGIEELRRPPTDGEIEWGITADVLKYRHYGRGGLDTDAAEHRQCWECHNRVTELADSSGREAGHARGWRHPRCSQHTGIPSGDSEALPRTLRHRPPWEVFPTSSLVPNLMSRPDPGKWTRLERGRARRNAVEEFVAASEVSDSSAGTEPTPADTAASAD